MTDLVDKWCSLEETAEYLGVTKDTIRNWIKKTDIPEMINSLIEEFLSNI